MASNERLDNKKLLPQQPSTLASLLSGTAAGASQVLVGQPLDTIKTRSQTAPQGAFSGPLDIALRTFRHEGPLAFYKGTTPPLIGVAGVNAILFTSYHGACRWFVRDQRDPVSGEQRLPLAKIAAAGAFAGAANTVAVGPVEMFKVRLQASFGKGVLREEGVLPGGDKVAGTGKASAGGALTREIRKVWNMGGLKNGIYRGFWITFIREIPATAAFYASYEYTKRHLSSILLAPKSSLSSLSPGSSRSPASRSINPVPEKRDELPIWALLVSGAAGGVGYWTACYPLDVIKSRVQFSDTPLPGRGISYIWKTAAEIYTNEGWRAFTRGLSPTYLRAVPAAASTFLAFELTMGYIQKHTNI